MLLLSSIFCFSSWVLMNSGLWIERSAAMGKVSWIEFNPPREQPIGSLHATCIAISIYGCQISCKEATTCMIQFSINSHIMRVKNFNNCQVHPYWQVKIVCSSHILADHPAIWALIQVAIHATLKMSQKISWMEAWIVQCFEIFGRVGE